MKRHIYTVWGIYINSGKHFLGEGSNLIDVMLVAYSDPKFNDGLLEVKITVKYVED